MHAARCHNGLTEKDRDAIFRFLFDSIDPTDLSGPCPVGAGCIAREAWLAKRYAEGVPLWSSADCRELERWATARECIVSSPRIVRLRLRRGISRSTSTYHGIPPNGEES